MKKILNNKGLSLIEVLATLTLLSIIGGLVFGVLLNSMHIFKHESDSNDIKQEANLISNQLTTFYKIYGDFEVVEDGDSILVYAPNKDDSKEVRDFSIPEYKITVLTSDNNSGSTYNTRKIEIKIIENKDKSNEFVLNSSISRIKEGEENG